jgi:FAD/FMN-containing dehydrogenase
MTVPLRSWGAYPDYPQTPHACYWRTEASRCFDEVRRAHATTLPFGNGRSYGDSCLASSGHVMHMRRLDRFIAADWEKGVLTVEAGVLLAEVLELALPRRWFLPVTPGTQFVTLGGALANDVHGKNHHRRGTFGCHVMSFGLLRSDGSLHTCSREENAHLFAATIGGLGLTGIVLWVQFQLLPVRSGMVACTQQRFSSLEEFFALSAELDPRHEYSVAWIDCLASGRQQGRGVFMVGDHAEEGPLLPARRVPLSVPVQPPRSLVNAWSLQVFNTAYWHMHSARRHTLQQTYESFFYPLDRVLQWNRIYGKKGFQQYQCVLPDANSALALKEILAAIASARLGSFLAVLKCCGPARSPGLLSFPLPGASLALDFPQCERLSDSLFPRLDRIVREAGGRLYPAKDAHMSAGDFQAAYPQWIKLEALRDPAINSRFWTRVTA